MRHPIYRQGSSTFNLNPAKSDAGDFNTQILTSRELAFLVANCFSLLSLALEPRYAIANHLILMQEALTLARAMDYLRFISTCNKAASLLALIMSRDLYQKSNQEPGLWLPREPT